MCDKFILSFFQGKKIRYYSILFLLVLWHIVTNLKITVNTIVNISAVILALIYPNGEFIPPYNLPSLRQAFTQNMCSRHALHTNN